MFDGVLAGVEVLAGVVDEDVDLAVTLVDLVPEPDPSQIIKESGYLHNLDPVTSASLVNPDFYSPYPDQNPYRNLFTGMKSY